MAKYNSRVNYNEGIKGNGANYNSATFFVVEVSEIGRASCRERV